MPDFSKMTVRSLRELARKLLGPGYSRLRTKAEIVRALEETAAAPARAVGKVRAAASRAADATGKAVRAVTEAVGKAARTPARRTPETPGAASAGTRKPAAKRAPEAAATAPEPARRRKGAAAAAGAVVGAALGAKAAAPARAGKKGRKVAAAAAKAAGAAVGAVVGAAAGERAARKGRTARPRQGPDPEGFFVARVRGEDAVREAPHPMEEPEPEADEDLEGPVPVIADEQLGELAWGYGDDAFVALPRDPRTVFLYWDFSPDAMARGFAGLDQARAQLWILGRTGAGWERVRTIEFALESRGYYVHDLQPGRTYRAEIHAVDRHGRERLLSHASNEVALPAVGPSPLVDDRFVRIPWELQLGRLLGQGHAGAPFPDEARALLAGLSDWSRFAGREVWGSAGGMGGRPSSPTQAPSSPAGPLGPRER